MNCSNFLTRRRRGTKAAVVLILAIMFMGCQLNDDGFEDAGFIPVGEWSDGFDGGYNITEFSVEYYSPDYGPDFPAQTLKGNIEKVVGFSDNSGALVIKITQAENMEHTPGKYTCVYYKEYSDNHVLLANPVGPAYETIEVDSLNAALALFTSGNMSTHVTFWGSGYTK